MHIRMLAIGERQPSWVDSAFDDYIGRLPRHWKFRLDCLSAARRNKRDGVATAVAAEAGKILASVSTSECFVLLDERGTAASSRQFAAKLDGWLALGRDLCFVMGGADGVSEECFARADFCLSLSAMTLPHGLARVFFAEQLYRAWSIGQSHPYHRD